MHNKLDVFLNTENVGARKVDNRLLSHSSVISLFRTHSSDSNFLSFVLEPGSTVLRKVRIRTRLPLSPSKFKNQLDQLHFMLFPKCTASGKGTRRASSSGKESFYANELSSKSAFLLHSSQSVIIVIISTEHLLHFKLSSKQLLHARSEGIWDMCPFSLHGARCTHRL